MARSSAIQQRRGQSSCGGTTQQRTPSSRPSRAGAASQQVGHALSLHPRQTGDELGCGETPPTSPANTTSLARPPRPTNSGYVPLCFAERAATPLTCVLGLVVPSRWIGLTIVVSMASWAPLKSGSPSATTLPSNTPTTPKSKSRTKTFVLTLAPASWQMRAAAVSKGNPLRPKMPTKHAAR